MKVKGRRQTRFVVLKQQKTSRSQQCANWKIQEPFKHFQGQFENFSKLWGLKQKQSEKDNSMLYLLLSFPV